MQQQIQQIYHTESRRVLSTLIRLLGDFELAEEALHDAFTAALEQWPQQGIPQQPRAWLVSTGRFKAIDQLRRRSRYAAHLAAWAEELQENTTTLDEETIQDDQLRLIFTCCHPSLAAEAQIALTLREVCGLTTEAIASAFLTRSTTLAQRIVRAKAKIRDAAIPYEIPAAEQLPERLDTVLQVVYLVFNEGYSASSGELLTRHDLCSEAIHLAELICALLQTSPLLAEVEGLLALLLLQDARRAARSDAAGNLILLEHQDRSRWNHAQIVRGLECLTRALRRRQFGRFTLQAAIAAVHAEARDFAATDWRQIVGLYDVLIQWHPSPVVALNRAVAVAMRDGPQRGLDLVDAIMQDGSLAEYHLSHAARADLLRRLGRMAEARLAYQRALELTQQGPEQRFLRQRLEELDARSP